MQTNYGLNFLTI